MSRKFSAELEELNGNGCDDIVGEMSNDFILQPTEEPMMMKAKRIPPSDAPRRYNVRNLHGYSDKDDTKLVSGPSSILQRSRKSRKASDSSNLKPFLSQSDFIYSYLISYLSVALLNTYMSVGMPRVSPINVLSSTSSNNIVS